MFLATDKPSYYNIFAEDYKLSAPANAVLNKIVSLEFNQQIAVLRLIVGKMGINPLTA